MAPDVEVTLRGENPDPRRGDALSRASGSGINGYRSAWQALDDNVLKELGLLLPAKEAIDAVAIARGAFEPIRST